MEQSQAYREQNVRKLHFCVPKCCILVHRQEGRLYHGCRQTSATAHAALDLYPQVLHRTSWHVGCACAGMRTASDAFCDSRRLSVPALRHLSAAPDEYRASWRSVAEPDCRPVLEGLCALAAEEGATGSDHVSAVVTVTDEGGSSGELRREFGILPPGDVRNCLAAVAPLDLPFQAAAPTSVRRR